MGMLNHESKQPKQKLERGTKIEIKNQVDRAQVLDDDTANKTVTIPINIRVDKIGRASCRERVLMSVGAV